MIETQLGSQPTVKGEPLEWIDFKLGKSCSSPKIIWWCVRRLNLADGHILDPAKVVLGTEVVDSCSMYTVILNIKLLQADIHTHSFFHFKFFWWFWGCDALRWAWFGLPTNAASSNPFFQSCSFFTGSTCPANGIEFHTCYTPWTRTPSSSLCLK